jgi:hypothetical protein
VCPSDDLPQAGAILIRRENPVLGDVRLPDTVVRDSLPPGRHRLSVHGLFPGFRNGAENTHARPYEERNLSVHDGRESRFSHLGFPERSSLKIARMDTNSETVDTAVHLSSSAHRSESDRALEERWTIPPGPRPSPGGVSPRYLPVTAGTRRSLRYRRGRTRGGCRPLWDSRTSPGTGRRVSSRSP